MFLKIFLFELRYRMKRPATYVYFGILFLLSLLVGILGNGPASEKAFVNGSYTIGSLLITISIFQMLIASAVMGVPVYRDIDYKTKDYFFTYPMGEKSYLLARYFGSFAVLLLIGLGCHFGYLLGVPIGYLKGEIEPERLGPFIFNHYAYNTIVFTIPNLFFSGTIFFSLVALTRNIRATYVGSVVLFITYLVMLTLSTDLENQTIVDILDPFGLSTYENASKYWTPLEQNLSLVPFSGNLLWNRVLWVGISLVVFAFTCFKFSFRSMLEVKTDTTRKASSDEKSHGPSLKQLPIATKRYSTTLFVQKLIRLSSLEFRNIIKDVYFISILLAGVLFLFLDGWFGNPQFGTPTLPLTYYMLEVKDFNYTIFVFVIIIFYTGEVVHRDRSVNYANIADALPVPNWIIYGSKFLALVLICFVLVNLVLICGVLNQVFVGYFNFQFPMYFTDLYLIELPEYLQLLMLAFIVHILINNKMVGHVAAIGIWILMFCIRTFGEINYNLFFYSYHPPYIISDLNGFGHFLPMLSWFNLYWMSLGVVFLILGILFWNRGSETSFSVRWRIAKQRLNPVAGFALTVFTLLWLGTGAFIYYNVSVLNRYYTNNETTEIGVKFEKKYKKYDRTPQPKITDAKLNIDIFPEQRSLKASGKFTIVNKTTSPIDSLIFQINPVTGYTTLSMLTIDQQPLQLLMKDTVNRFYIYKLPNQLLPKDTALLEVSLSAGYKGFTNGGFGREIVYNGTFFDLGIFPQLGYPGDPISSDKERKKHGLPKVEWTLPPQDDSVGLHNLLFNNDADYVTYEAVVSTSLDQIALSPGYLQREWEENGRKYYHYKLDDLGDLFANFSSARYAVTRDTWTGTNGQKVAIELYHHPDHNTNLDRFTKSIKSSFDYFTKNFAPYQYRQIRILEFPRYATFAQSFPNTVPYAESFGWAADFSDPEDTDYAFYVTSHEVAHQWWGHMVTPSATRGANQISESMAEYSALMVLKHEYGDESMQRFLKYSLDRYLRGRAGESKFEATLLENDSRSYVWYQKGSLVLYALQDLIGEERLNQGFRNFLDTAAFRTTPPFPTSNEWYSYIKAATPDSLKYFIEDSFEKITLYENRITEATYEKQKDNKYKVTLAVQSKKVYYDKTGAETGVGDKPNLIDIAIFDEDGKNAFGITRKIPLYQKRHWLKPGDHTLTFIVDKKPVKAGIDPYNKLIDRIPDDNVKTVSEK